MQTNPWMPVPVTQSPATPARPGWPQVLAWYFAGMFATGATFSLIVAVAQLVSGTAGALLARLMCIAAIVLLCTKAASMPRRSRIALVLGAVTPIVLMAAVIVYLAYSFAHSNWQF